jgi:hypothetical protein
VDELLAMDTTSDYYHSTLPRLLTVWYRGMLKKLHAYGVCGFLLKVIKNSLFDRSLLVVLNGSISHEYSVKARAPQASALGPSLFLIYINEMGDNFASALLS